MSRLSILLPACFVCAVVLSGATTETSRAAAPQQVSQEEQRSIDAILAVQGKGQPSAEEMQRLTAELKNPSPLVRTHAAQALGHLGAAAKSAVPALVPLVADPDPRVRRAASRAVLTIRPGPAVTLPLVKKLLADADPTVRMTILHTLADLGKPALPGLIAALQDDEAAKYACLVLAEIGPDAADAIPALAERLKIEQRPEVRQQIVMALGAIGSAAAVPTLSAELTDRRETTRVAAAFGLGRIGPAAKTADAELTKAMTHDDPVLRAVSAWARVKINPADQAAKDQAVTILTESLISKNPLARTAAFRALADLRPGPDRVLPALAKHLQSKDKAVVAEALQALAALGEPAVPALIKALQLPEHRPLAASILAQIGPPAKAAVPGLIEVVANDASPVAKREALLALGCIGEGAAAAAPAATAALADRHEKVMLAACFALSKFGPAAKPAIPALKKLASDKDDLVRQEATKALSAIEGK